MSNGQGTKESCKVCGFKIRGSNHVEGQHHKRAQQANLKTVKQWQKNQ